MSPSTSRSLDDFRMTALLNFFMEIPDKFWETKNSVKPRWNYTGIEVISHDDVIKSSGYRIGPFGVESALLEHPVVQEAAIVGFAGPYP